MIINRNFNRAVGRIGQRWEPTRAAGCDESRLLHQPATLTWPGDSVAGSALPPAFVPPRKIH